MKSLLTLKFWILALSFFSSVSVFAQVSGKATQKYSCKAEFSFEYLEFTEPKLDSQGQYKMSVVDLTTLQMMSVQVKGTITADAFDVRLEKVDMLHLDGKRGRLVGQKLADQSWDVVYFPQKKAINGATSVNMVCDPL